MWLRDCWYVIAYDHEVQADGLLARKVLNEPLVLYRTDADEIVALADRCPHRHAPLSKGCKEGDSLRCGYHGLKFAPDGRCTEVPGMEQPPSHLRVKSFPVAVRHTWVFIWMGDPAKADEAMLPDNWSCDHPGWKNKPGYLHYDTPYLLICDNLLDFSHLSYVHAKTLGGSTQIALARPTVEKINEDGQRGIRVSRHIADVPPPPFYQRFRSFDSNLDRWFVYDFLFPGTLLMSSGGRPTGDASDDNSRAVLLHSCQTLTPETETSTHYFWSQSHPRAPGDEGIAESIHNSIVTAFNEDRDIITAQYKNLAAKADEPMVPLHMDSALLQFRSFLEAEVARENSAAENEAD
jgi:phenylpropionate dioxygenase-like ring-hydroxylating dioxygenase large terminal subunit